MLRAIRRIIISENLLGINSGASYFSHSFLAWSNILWKTFSQLLLFCRRISSTLSISSITANISNYFFCSSFETGRIIPEVCCITKVAIKNVHFWIELSKVAALVATSTCLFSCCISSSVETTAGNSVTQMMIESYLSTQRVSQIGFSFCRKEAEPETSLSTSSRNIDTRWAERDRKTHMSDIVAIAFLITGNCDEVLMTKWTWLQQCVYVAKGYNSFTLAWTPQYFPLILLAPS